MQLPKPVLNLLWSLSGICFVDVSLVLLYSSKCTFCCFVEQDIQWIEVQKTLFFPCYNITPYIIEVPCKVT